MNETIVATSLIVVVILAAGAGYAFGLGSPHPSTTTIDSTTITSVSITTITSTLPPYLITCDIINFPKSANITSTSGTAVYQTYATNSNQNWTASAYVTVTDASRTAGYVISSTTIHDENPFNQYARVTNCTYLP